LFECCSNCSKLYNKFQNESCDQAKGFINFNGQIVTRHNACKSFHFEQFFSTIKESDAKDIFWVFWSQIQNFGCQKCGIGFNGS
jgi:hypothetical protein